MAFQGATSSSSSRQWAHDVFLSFRGTDTRKTFTADLHKALTQKGIITYIDDDNLRRGEEISGALLEAIDESRISVVVLSENYASSSWCLDELIRIVECKKTKQQIVLPVFYKVDPSEVRLQRKSYGEGLAKLEGRFKDDRLQKWKAALKEVADSSEWRLRKKGSASELIKKIVQWVSRVVNRTYLNIATNPVGVETHVQEINSHLSIGMNDIRMIGIFGPGGIGKTTIAKEIYNLIAYQFEGSCFLANIRETSKQDLGLVQLQKTLLCEILGKIGSLKFVDVDRGINVIKKRLRSKRVLLILDDVDELVQLETLAGKHDWFGLGSRIIITTRDRNLLSKHEVNSMYRVRELDHNEALQLFSWHAFKKDRPDDDYLELTERVIQYAGGLPLALTELGTDLYGRSVHHWKSALDRYKRIPNKNIQEKLRISYDGLGDTEKNIFLDIACFFNRYDADYVIKILDNCGFFPNNGIKVLMDKSLITIDEFNRLIMHHLLQEMGRQIVQLESKEPGQRSRLWFHEDVRHVLEENTGTNKIQGILIDLPDRDLICLSFEAFEKMKKLRIFINHNACFSEEPSFLSNELRLLDWPEYIVESLPSNFHGENLVVFRMRSSCLKGLKGFQNFQNLTILDFSNCKFLRKIPDVLGIPNLKEVTLDGCTNLVEIHHFVGFLDKLLDLSLQECSNLRSSLRSFKVRSPEYLSLENCSRLKNFPPIESPMECVRSIDLRYIGIEKELPSSIGCIVGLKKLNLQGCINLMNLPSSIHQLQHLEFLLLSEGHFKGHPFDIILLGNKIRDQSSDCKGASNSNSCEINIDKSCEIDINEPAYLDGEMGGIAFSAVFGIMDGHMEDSFDFFVDISSDGSDQLCYHVRESFKLKGDDLQVCFGFESDSSFLKNCRVRMLCRQEEKATDHMLNPQDLGVLHEDVDVHLGVPDEDIENSIDMMDGIRLTKRCHDDDDYGNLESNWYPQQKRRSSTLDIKISDERICHLVNHSYTNQITPST